MKTIKFYSDSAKTDQVTPESGTWGTYTLTVAGWSSSTTNGYYTQSISIEGMSGDYYPTLIPVYSSSSTVEDEKDAFGSLVEIETTTDAIVAKVLEKPSIALTFILKGV